MAVLLLLAALALATSQAYPSYKVQVDGYVPCRYSMRDLGVFVSRGEWVSPVMRCRGHCPKVCANPAEMWPELERLCEFMTGNEYLALLTRANPGMSFGRFSPDPWPRPPTQRLF